MKFCWVGDLDGDGEFDFVVDRQSGEGFRQFLEAYKRDGTLLWRIDLGPNSFYKYNIEPGSSTISLGHGDNVTVYDMDGDGKSEVLLRTANGVVFGNGNVVSGGASDNVQFLSVIDGLTGAELARATVPNPRLADGPMNGHMGILYLDGKRPSVLWAAKNRDSSNAFHGIITAWDWRGGSLTQRWSWVDSGAIHAPEGHQIRIADVDNDGKDEFVEIGFVIDDNGTQLFNVPEMVHGDRFHVTDIDPDRPGLENFIIQQNNGTGLATAIFDVGTGGMIRKWYAGGVVDVGRGVAGDFDPAVKGCEFFSTQPGIFDCKGNKLPYTSQPFPPETIWWDSDLVREFVSTIGSSGTSPGIDKFNTATGTSSRVISLYSDTAAPGSPYNNYIAYGGRPQFWGDILGDWREELLCAATDNSELRIYSVRSPDSAKSSNGTGFRIPTLMHNPQYRLQATTKGYVQSSYTDFYLGTGMTPPPPAPMVDAKLVWRGGTGATTWDSGTTASWLDNGANSTFAAGDSVRFDIGGDATTTVALNGTLQPAAVTVYSPKNYTFDGSTGSLAGPMTLMKSGSASLTLSGNHSFSGNTTVWDGALVMNGSLTQSPLTVWGGTWGGAPTGGLKGGRVAGTGTFSQPAILAYRGGVTPGSGMGNAGTLSFAGGLTARDGSYFAMDLSNDPSGSISPSDKVAITGNLSLSGKVGLVVKPLSGQSGTRHLHAHHLHRHPHRKCLELRRLRPRRHALHTRRRRGRGHTNRSGHPRPGRHRLARLGRHLGSRVQPELVESRLAGRLRLRRHRHLRRHRFRQPHRHPGRSHARRRHHGELLHQLHLQRCRFHQRHRRPDQVRFRDSNSHHRQRLHRAHHHHRRRARHRHAWRRRHARLHRRGHRRRLEPRHQRRHPAPHRHPDEHEPEPHPRLLRRHPRRRHRHQLHADQRRRRRNRILGENRPRHPDPRQREHLQRRHRHQRRHHLSGRIHRQCLRPRHRCRHPQQRHPHHGQRPGQRDRRLESRRARRRDRPPQCRRPLLAHRFPNRQRDLQLLLALRPLRHEGQLVRLHRPDQPRHRRRRLGNARDEQFRLRHRRPQHRRGKLRLFQRREHQPHPQYR